MFFFCLSRIISKCCIQSSICYGMCKHSMHTTQESENHLTHSHRNILMAWHFGDFGRNRFMKKSKQQTWYFWLSGRTDDVVCAVYVCEEIPFRCIANVHMPRWYSRHSRLQAACCAHWAMLSLAALACMQPTAAERHASNSPPVIVLSGLCLLHAINFVVSAEWTDGRRKIYQTHHTDVVSAAAAKTLTVSHCNRLHFGCTSPSRPHGESGQQDSICA